MRLDLFLKHSRIVPRRTIAQQMCEAGAVRVNGAPAKSSREVNAGDELTIRYRSRLTTLRVVNIPQRPPSKAEAASLYETLDVEFLNTD